jgi:hypothetical protein
MSDGVLQQIEADIAEAERLMTELRLKIAVGQSAGEDTTESERRVQEMLKGWMLLQDQRAKASREPITIKSSGSQEVCRRSFSGHYISAGSRSEAGEKP